MSGSKVVASDREFLFKLIDKTVERISTPPDTEGGLPYYNGKQPNHDLR